MTQRTLKKFHFAVSVSDVKESQKKCGLEYLESSSDKKVGVSQVLLRGKGGGVREVLRGCGGGYLNASKRKRRGVSKNS